MRVGRAPCRARRGGGRRHGKPQHPHHDSDNGSDRSEAGAGAERLTQGAHDGPPSPEPSAGGSKLTSVSWMRPPTQRRGTLVREGVRGCGLPLPEASASETAATVDGQPGPAGATTAHRERIRPPTAMFGGHNRAP